MAHPQQANLALVALGKGSLPDDILHSPQVDLSSEKTPQYTSGVVEQAGSDGTIICRAEAISAKELLSWTALDKPQSILADVYNTSVSKLDAAACRGDLLRLRSNYQWIASGNQQQVGLNHPQHLTADLNSKRLERKTNEKQRRDRVRAAVDKMAAVLPRDSVQSGRKQTEVAATIEFATEYIKALQEALKRCSCDRLA